MSSIDLSQNEFFLNFDDIQKVETRKKKKWNVFGKKSVEKSPCLQSFLNIQNKFWSQKFAELYSLWRVSDYKFN